MTSECRQLEPVTVRRAGPADADALLALHRAGFGSQWRREHWSWRFVDNPLGRTEIIGAFRNDGSCDASFCGVPLPCRYADRTALVQRSGDVIVHPRLRRSMAGAQLLLRTAECFFRTFGGGDTRIVFGFPEPGLSRTITRHCRFEVLSDVLWLVRAVDGPPARASERVTFDTGIPADIDDLIAHWNLAGGGLGIVRDRRYLQWRYAANPHADYVGIALRSPGGALRAFAMLRPAGAHPDALLLLEWLVPNDDPGASAELLAAATAAAQAHDRQSLVASFAGWCPDFAAFQRDHGFHVLPSPHQLVYRSYAAGLDRRHLATRWYHSLGDMDFL